MRRRAPSKAGRPGRRAPRTTSPAQKRCPCSEALADTGERGPTSRSSSRDAAGTDRVGTSSAQRRARRGPRLVVRDFMTHKTDVEANRTEELVNGAVAEGTARASRSSASSAPRGPRPGPAAGRKRRRRQVMHGGMSSDVTRERQRSSRSSRSCAASRGPYAGGARGARRRGGASRTSGDAARGRHACSTCFLPVGRHESVRLLQSRAVERARARVIGGAPSATGGRAAHSERPDGIALAARPPERLEAIHEVVENVIDGLGRPSG